jgi:hypothetical protein
LKAHRKHIFLRITNQGIFYNAIAKVDWDKTNFPSKESFHFNERTPIFWQVELCSFEKSRNCLEVEVVDYDVQGKVDAFTDQTPKYPIWELVFRRLTWKPLVYHLSIYQRSAFDELLGTDQEFPAIEGKSILKANTNSENGKLIGQEKFRIKTSCSLMKVTFKLGYVEVTKRVKGISRPVRMRIYNDHIIPEFDHVKPFFAKVLEKRKIAIEGYATINTSGKIQTKCYSRDITRINEEVITGVRRLRIRDRIMHPKIIAVDKTLFTPGEFFGESEEPILGNTLRKDDRLLLKEILEIEGVRNRKQMVYLSGRLQSEESQIKFTLSPQFGFLFYVNGEEMDHFVWELLNSHATYLWSADKDAATIEEKFALLEREISFIREHGRTAFLTNKFESVFEFTKINHASGESNVVDGFPRWKMRLNERLV